MVITFLKTKFFEWQEQKKVSRTLYSSPRFRAIDEALQALYQDKSPYQISSHYLKTIKAPNPHVYGETPLTTLARIACFTTLSQNDCVIELGAGRGRAAFYLAATFGCQVVAYENIPHFVETGRALASAFELSNMTWIQGDLLKADLSQATLVYLYGTLLSDEEIKQLLQTLQKCPVEAKIITVSYPLSDYSPEYRTERTLMGRFPWGETEIYLQRKI